LIPPKAPKPHSWQRLLRWWIMALLLPLGSAAVAGPAASTSVQATPQEKTFLERHPVWRVTGDPSWRPFCFRSADGHLVGLDVENSKLFAERIGVRIEWVDVPTWAEALKRFRSGDVDLLMGTAQTPERDQEMLFTSAYAASPVAVITRLDAPFLVSLSELAGKTVAVPEAHVTTDYLRKLPIPLKLVTFSGLDDATRAVSQGKADAMVAGLVPAATSVKALDLDNLKVAGLVDVRFDLKIAVRKDWPQARDLLEAAIAADPPEVRIERFDRWLQPILGLQRQAMHWRRLSWLGLGMAGSLAAFLVGATLWNRMLKHQVDLATAAIRREMAARAESELRFRTIFEKAPLGMYRSTPEGQFLSVNRFLAELFEYESPEHMVEVVNRQGISKSLFQDPQQRTRIVASVLERMGGMSVNHVHYLSRSGRIIEALLSMTAIHDPVDGQVTLLGFVQDITAHTREEATRRQREKLLALGQMASGVAHDFNNLLCVILAETDQLTETQISNPQFFQSVRRIQASVSGAVGLTERLLRFMRAKGGELAMEYDAHQAIGIALDLFKSTVGRGVLVEDALRAQQTLIKGYQTDFQNALLNLFLNARDAMDQAGNLSIRTRNLELTASQCEALKPEKVEPGLFLEVQVIDSGPGMTEEVLRNCRQPFFSTKGEAGTGLGLWMVHGVMADHAGAWRIESRLGQGTTVVLLLPLVQNQS